MKVYLVTDLEGVGGVCAFDVRDSLLPGDADLRRGWSQLWIDEVNAAVGGAVAAGAREILVLDNHGPGTSLPADRLASPACLLHGGGRPTWLAGLDASFDAVAVVGQHAMAGAGQAHLCHTYSRRRLDRVGVGEREIGEIGLIVGIAGEAGVPVVFLSGDAAAASEFLDLVPEGHVEVVKRGLTRQACISLAPRDCCQRLRHGVEAALRRIDEVPPRPLAPPFEIRLRYVRRHAWRAAARRLLGGGGLRWRGGRELRVRGDSLRQAWDRCIGLEG